MAHKFNQWLASHFLTIASKRKTNESFLQVTSRIKQGVEERRRKSQWMGEVLGMW